MLIGIWAWGIPIARLFYDACLLEFGLGRAGSLRKHFFRPLISARRAPIACLFSDACLFRSRHAGHPSHATSIARLKKMRVHYRKTTDLMKYLPTFCNIRKITDLSFCFKILGFYDFFQNLNFTKFSKKQLL